MGRRQERRMQRESQGLEAPVWSHPSRFPRTAVNEMLANCYHQNQIGDSLLILAWCVRLGVSHHTWNMSQRNAGGFAEEQKLLESCQPQTSVSKGGKLMIPVRSMALMNKARRQEMGWEWLLTPWYICRCPEVPELELVYVYMYQILSVFAKQYELVLSRIAHHQNHVCAQWSWT